MAKVLNKTKGFGSISRDCVYDNELSDRARFLYVYMACKPENWEFYQDQVAKELNYKKDTLRKYLDELIIRGWITESEQQNDGKFGCLEYVIEIKRKSGNLPIRKKTDTEKTRIGKNHNHKDIDNISSDNNISSDKKDIEEKVLSDDNTKKDESCIDVLKDSFPDFTDFWKKYHQGSKQVALKRWNNMSHKDQKLAIDMIDDYLVYCKRSKRPKKDVATFLYNKCYLDDYKNIIPDYYQVQPTDNGRMVKFKQYMVDRFRDLIYHRNPLTFEQASELLEQYDTEQFEDAMDKLAKVDIHQYFSILKGVETILNEGQ